MTPGVLHVQTVSGGTEIAERSTDLTSSGIGRPQQKTRQSVACIRAEVRSLRRRKLNRGTGCVFQNHAGMNQTSAEFDGVFARDLLRIADPGVLPQRADLSSREVHASVAGNGYGRQKIGALELRKYC